MFCPAEVAVLSFTGVYEAEDFWRGVREGILRFLELGDIRGTNGYLSEEGRTEVLRRLGAVPAPGIHFLDSGNTHYMSKLLMDGLREPFALVLADHHPDLLPPAFGGLLSCGSWVRAALCGAADGAGDSGSAEAASGNPFLREVWLLGVDEALAREALSEEEGGWAEDPALPGALSAGLAGRRMVLLPEAALHRRGAALGPCGDGGLQASQETAWGPVVAALGATGLPVWLSVDKDILDTEEVRTNWDQGGVRAWELFSLLRALRDGVRLLGVDICGECGLSGVHASLSEAIKENDACNKKMLDIFLKNV